MVLNEILASPALIDWDGNGTADEGDEWIELLNVSSSAINLGGWALVAGENDLTLYRFPRGTVLEPDALIVLYQAQTGLVLDDGGGSVRLLGPRGGLRDRVLFPKLAPDASYSRDEHGVWHADWPPTPGGPNVSFWPAAGAKRLLSSSKL